MWKRMFVLMLAVTATALPAQADVWNFDQAHSTVGFSVRHLVISKTTGSFTDYSGQVNFDGQNLETGSVEITIQVASIDTDDEKRDGHLRGADFFDVEKYPTMIFKSKKLVKGSGNTFTMTGDLTIKDVTREVTLEGEFNGVVADPWGNTRAGFSVSTKINRQNFNVAWSNKLKDGSLVVGNDVTINLEIELIMAKPEQAEGK